MSEKEDTSAGIAPAPRRRRVWLRVLIGLCILLVIVIVLALLAPAIASTDAGTRWITGIANNRIKGKFSIAALSTSWSGPTEISQLQVLDPQGREVLSTAKAYYSGGVWLLVTRPENFRRVTITSPVVILYRDAEGRPSIADAIEPRQPPSKPPSERTQPTEPWAQQPREVQIIQGLVRVVAPSGASYELNHLESTLNLESMQRIQMRFQLNSPEGTKISGDGTIVDLYDASGQLQPNRANIQGGVTSDGHLDLAPLSAVFMPGSELAGKAGFAVKADVAGGQGKATVDLALQQLRRARAGRQIQPVNINVNGVVNFSSKQMDGQLLTRGEPGEVQFQFVYPLGQNVKVNSDYASSALVTGKDVALPDFDVRGRGRIDLARLEQAVPGVLGMRQDVTVSEGAMELPEFTAHGGGTPAAKFTARVTGLRGQGPRGAFQMQPIDGNCDLAIEPNVGLHVKPARVNSAFMKFEAQGTPADLTAKFDADLAALEREVSGVFDLGLKNLSGTVAGTFSARRGSSGAIDVASDLRGQNLQYASASGNAQLASLLVRHEGTAELDNNKLVRYVLKTQRIESAQDLLADMKGWYDFRQSTMDLTATLQRADLATVGRLAAGLGVKGMERWSGQATGKAAFARGSSQEPIKGNVDVGLNQVAVDGKFVSRGNTPVTFRGENLQYDPDAKNLQASSVNFASDFANFKATDLRMQRGSETLVEGKYSLDADIQPTLTVLSRFQFAQNLPEMAGKLAGSGGFSTKEKQLAATGTTTVNDFAVTREGKTVREKQLSFNYDMLMDSPRDRMDIKTFQFRSVPLEVSMTGNIQKLSTDKILDLDVNYRGSWEHLVNLMHQFAPATAETIAIRGQTADQFKVTGSAYDPNITPRYADVAAKPSVGWSDARFYGLEMSQAKLTPSMQKGHIVLPPTSIPGTAGGQANLAGDIDMTGPVNILRVPGRVRVLDNLVINKDVGTHILSRINPILGQTTSMRGRIVLETTDMVLPLGEEIKRQGSGQGMLDLSNLEVVPAGALGDLVHFAGLGRAGTYALSVQKVNFTLRNGRISYDRFVMRIVDFDVEFRGWVDFDDNVNMVVSLPLTPNLLQQLKIPGLPSNLTKNMTNVRVEIPFRGKRQAPMLDLKAVDTGAILKQLGGGLGGVEKGIEKPLRGIFGGEKK